MDVGLTSEALPPTSELPTVHELVDRVALANPSYPALATVRNTVSLEASYLETTTWGDLVAISKRAAYYLTAPEYGIGLKRGSTVALWASNRADTWMASFLACSRIGALVVNLNPRFREAEMEHFLRTADPDLIILEDGLLGVDYLRMAIECAPTGGKMAVLNLGSSKGAVPEVRGRVKKVASLPPGFSFDCPDPVPELPPECRGQVDSPLVCFSTSGTTGPSKLAMHTHRSVVRMAVDISFNWDMRPAKGTMMEGKQRYGKVLDWGGRKEVMELDTGEPTFENRIRDVSLVCVPYCGAFGFHSVFSMLIGAGGTVLILDGYNPDIAAYYLHNYCPLPIPDPPAHLRGATHVGLPDAVHADLLARAHLYGRVPSSPGEVVPYPERPYKRWRYALSSNFANICREVIRKAQAVVPHMFMTQSYGMSESMASLGTWPRRPYMERVGGVWTQTRVPDAEETGRAGGFLNNVLEMDIRVVDPDSGKAQPPGRDTPGEIHLRGPQVHAGYLNNPEATAKSIVPAEQGDPDRRPWFKTGDFGYIAGGGKADGFAFLNRLGDSLRLRGFLTNPGEIEDLIKTHPAIVEAQVVGCQPTVTVGGIVQDAAGTGDVPVAFVILREELRKAAEEERVKKEVIALCREKLANYKVPAEVFYVTEYPVTVAANGVKIQKHRLREMARERGVTLTRGQGPSGAKVEARL
ncbi:hypothetical protein DFJ74DRAFT_363768 [Hyaloraphidium curvatum]|nr:hypothetical protein DFJ74DRAFT_363768 [Hyaloraphidium curvatum]